MLAGHPIRQRVEHGLAAYVTCVAPDFSDTSLHTANLSTHRKYALHKPNIPIQILRPWAVDAAASSRQWPNRSRPPTAVAGGSPGAVSPGETWERCVQGRVQRGGEIRRAGLAGETREGEREGERARVPAFESDIRYARVPAIGFTCAGVGTSP